MSSDLFRVNAISFHKEILVSTEHWSWNGLPANTASCGNPSEGVKKSRSRLGKDISKVLQLRII
jgi:hypothetical protein